MTVFPPPPPVNMLHARPTRHLPWWFVVVTVLHFSITSTLGVLLWLACKQVSNLKQHGEAYVNSVDNKLEQVEEEIRRLGEHAQKAQERAQKAEAELQQLREKLQQIQKVERDSENFVTRPELERAITKAIEDKLQLTEGTTKEIAQAVLTNAAEELARQVADQLRSLGLGQEVIALMRMKLQEEYNNSLRKMLEQVTFQLIVLPRKPPYLVWKGRLLRKVLIHAPNADVETKSRELPKEGDSYTINNNFQISITLKKDEETRSHLIELDWDEKKAARSEVAKILRGMTVIVVSDNGIKVFTYRQPPDAPEVAAEPKPGK